jgi:hypothetical protein
MGFERATAAQIRSPTIQKENWGVGLTISTSGNYVATMLGAYEARNALVCPFRLSGSRHWSSPSRLLLQACKADSVSASLISRQTCYVACWHQTDLVLEG